MEPSLIAANWTIVSGNCVVDRNCVQSPNFPDRYDNNDSCEFRAAEGFAVTSEDFNTERFYDTLTVNGISFSGDCGPRQVLAEGSILWTSSGAAQSSGSNPITTHSHPTPPFWHTTVLEQK